MGGVFGSPLVLKDLITLGQLSTFFNHTNYVYTTVADHVETIYTVPAGLGLILTNLLIYKTGGTVGYMRSWINNPSSVTVAIITQIYTPSDYTVGSRLNSLLIPSGYSIHLGTNVTAATSTAYVEGNGMLVAYSG